MLVFSGLQEGNWDLYAWYGDGRNELVRLTNTPFDEKSPALSPNRKTLAYVTSGGELMVRDLATGTDRQLHWGDRRGSWDFPNFSPDGRQLVATYYEPGGRDTARLVVIDLDTGQAVNLLQQYGPQLWPAWSPDGSTIVYGYGLCSDACGRIIQEPWLAHRGGARAYQLAITGAMSSAFAWAPDQRHVAFVSDRNRDFDIWMLALDGGGLTRLTDDRGTDDSPAFSPDGRSIGFISNRSGRLGIWLLELDTGELLQFQPPGEPGIALIKDLEWR